MPFWPFWPLNFKRPSLVDAIKLDKFDDKIMIYIEFCIRKSILIFWGVSNFVGEGPQNPNF